MPKTPPRLTFAGIAFALAALAGGGVLHESTALAPEGPEDDRTEISVVRPVDAPPAPRCPGRLVAPVRAALRV